MKRVFKIAGRVVTFLTCFVCTFLVVQAVMIPNYTYHSTIQIQALKNMKKNSVDVLFLGSCYTFCSIDAKMLFDDYNISAFDYSAASQGLETTYYYFQEALKTQTPKVVVVELGSLFWDRKITTAEKTLYWNYMTQDYSKEKYESLLRILDGDKKLALKYCFPLFSFHSRWDELGKDDFSKLNFKKEEYQNRGYTPRESHKIEPFFSIEPYWGNLKEVPDVNIQAVLDIERLADSIGATLLFLKTPVSRQHWSILHSASAQAFCDEYAYEFLDLNKNVEQFCFDFDIDFFDEGHLSDSGAKKVTKVVADWLQDFV